MIRAGVVRAFARVGFNLRGGRLHGRKPVQVSGASARHTLLSPGGDAIRSLPRAVSDAEVEGELLSRSPEASVALKDVVARSVELGVAHLCFARLAHVLCFFFLRSPLAGVSAAGTSTLSLRVRLDMDDSAARRRKSWGQL
jgi:hypothetical protein